MSEQRRFVPEAEPIDLADEQQVKQRTVKAEIREARRKRTWTALLSTEEGRELVWHILAQAHTSATSFVMGDPYATAFQEGERNLGLKILGEVMNASPQLYVQMLHEGEAAKKDA